MKQQGPVSSKFCSCKRCQSGSFEREIMSFVRFVAVELRNVVDVMIIVSILHTARQKDDASLQASAPSCFLGLPSLIDTS